MKQVRDNKAMVGVDMAGGVFCKRFVLEVGHTILYVTEGGRGRERVREL